MSDVINIKPHHFIDIITKYGAGTLSFSPHPYGHAVHSVAKNIIENHDSLLEIDLGADDICKPCIHNISGICDDTIDTSYRSAAPQSMREWNLLIDRRWCKRLGIGQGDRLSAIRLCEKIRDMKGDITGIYREIPAHLTAERLLNLGKGIELYHSTSSTIPYFSRKR